MEEATAEDASPARPTPPARPSSRCRPAHTPRARLGRRADHGGVVDGGGGGGADAGIDFSPRASRRVGVKSGHGRRGSADEPARKVAAAGADIFPFPANESPPAPAPVAGAPGMAPHAPPAPPLFGALFGVATAAAHGGAQEAALAAALRYHPYGALSDLHVEVLLSRALQAVAALASVPVVDL